MGTVTAEPEAVPGCVIEPLGSMRHLPAGTPMLRQAYLSGQQAGQSRTAANKIMSRRRSPICW